MLALDLQFSRLDDVIHFPEAAESTASDLWNGRKIRTANANFSGLAAAGPGWRNLGCQLSQLEPTDAAESWRLNPHRPRSRCYRLRCWRPNLQSPARVRPSALEDAPANRSQPSPTTGKPTPSCSLANQKGGWGA
jgi:hypothetical protein